MSNYLQQLVESERQIVQNHRAGAELGRALKRFPR